MSIRIINANALALPLEDNSVDLVVTSPPYFGLRSYTDGGEHYAGQIGAEATPAEFVDALIAATREMVRVTKPSGSIWVNLGDKYVADNRGSGGNTKRGAAKWAPAGPAGYPGEGIMPRKSLMGLPWRYALRCIDELGLILRAEVIWSKPNGMPESVTDRVRRSHEQWFHFTLSPRYYANLDAVREHYSGERALSRRVKLTGTGAAGNLQSTSAWTQENPLGSIPRSVQTVATEPLNVPDALGVDHFAAFPMWWPRWIISGWCPPGDECACCGGTPAFDDTCSDCGCDTGPGTVLDPFGGTGTTALVADVLGRDAIHVDLSADYCRLAEWRTTDPRERARAAQVDPVEAIPDGQLSLFEDAQ